jgi:hypothetical protein
VVAMAWPRVDERQRLMVADSWRKTTAGDGAPPGDVAGGLSSETVGNIDETVQLWAGLDDGEKLAQWWSKASTTVWRRVQWRERDRSDEWDEEEEKWGWGFSCCAHARDKVAAHVGWRRSRDPAQRALARSVSKPPGTVPLGRAQVSCRVLFLIKQNRSNFEIQNEYLPEFKTCLNFAWGYI